MLKAEKDGNGPQGHQADETSGSQDGRPWKELSEIRKHQKLKRRHSEYEPAASKFLKNRLSGIRMLHRNISHSGYLRCQVDLYIETNNILTAPMRYIWQIQAKAFRARAKARSPTPASPAMSLL
jgi:hypothetical protein